MRNSSESAPNPRSWVGLHLARDIHSAPLILEALNDLASLEIRIGAGRAIGWLMLIKDHPTAKQDVQDRAYQLTREAERLLSAEQIQRGIEAFPGSDRGYIGLRSIAPFLCVHFCDTRRNRNHPRNVASSRHQ